MTRTEVTTTLGAVEVLENSVVVDNGVDMIDVLVEALVDIGVLDEEMEGVVDGDTERDVVELIDVSDNDDDATIWSALYHLERNMLPYWLCWSPSCIAFRQYTVANVGLWQPACNVCRGAKIVIRAGC